MRSYAMMTLVIVLTPSVMDSATVSAADAAFYSGLKIFAFIAVCATVAVLVFDTFTGSKRINATQR